jgi:hypothetical protein
MVAVRMRFVLRAAVEAAARASAARSVAGATAAVRMYAAPASLPRVASRGYVDPPSPPGALPDRCVPPHVLACTLSAAVAEASPRSAYHTRADRTLDLLMEQLDALGDRADLPGYDATFSVGRGRDGRRAASPC